MERKRVCEDVNKIPISRIQKYYNGRGFISDSLVLSPLVNFRTLEGPPSAIDGLTIGVVCNGTAKTVINGRAYEMRSNSVFLLREDSVMESFRCSKACMGYLITYSREFLDMINVDTIDFLASHTLFGMRSCFSVDAASGERLHRMLTMLYDAARASAGDVYGDKIVASLFSSFFYTLISVVTANADSMKAEGRRNRSDELLAQFFATLGTDCERERSVEYYAAKLDISPKYLSLICKNKTGHNASWIIDDAVIRKAKKLLMQTGMSVQEVSDRLNFVSQSFFGKYFKQRVGISPSRYKVGVYDRR